MLSKLKSLFYQYYGRLVKKSNIKKAEDEIIQFEALDCRSKEKVRTERLLNLLKRAYEEVPFYRGLFDQNDLYFSDAQSLVDFEKIPILTKKIIRENFERIKNIHINNFRWFTSNTSGSTGDPLIFIIDQDFYDIKMGLRNFQFRINDRNANDTLIKLWNNYFGVIKSGGEWKRSVGNWLRNQVDLDTSYMSDEIMALFVKLIKRKKSVYIEAFAQSVYEVAKYINRNAIEIDNVTAITPTVSTLFDFMRDEIEKAFNCPVYNRYGAMEASVIAFERKNEDGMGISSSQYLVEVLDENGCQCQPGEEGDIVITNFSNFAFPFIRYTLGDRAVVKELAQFPIKSCLSFEKVTGRISELFLKEDGSFVNAHYFAHLIGQSYNSGWIDKMQIIQLSYDHIQVNIVKIENKTESENEIPLMKKAIRNLMGEKCQVDFRFVDKIEASPSGKYQYLKSMVNKKEMSTPS
jgi:phenylacetate-CoA ligase